MFKLIVGLGNPGIKYRWTRHNLGFLVVEEFVKQKKLVWERQKIFKADIAWIRQEKVVICKPLSYVNCSGEVIKKLAQKYHIDNKNILVICDDLNLPLGKIRTRKKGSGGGHNGLKSIIDCLGTKEFGRLRVGISPLSAIRYPLSAADYVLGKFTREEKRIIKEVVVKATQAVDLIMKEGIEKAMNEYN